MNWSNEVDYILLFCALVLAAMSVWALVDALKERLPGPKFFGYFYFASLASLAVIYLREWLGG
jgi:hypothetical protein